MKKLLGSLMPGTQMRNQVNYTPWTWAWSNGVFAGDSGVWLYKAADPPSLVFTTEEIQEAEARRIKHTLTELSQVARDTRWSRFAGRREFHLLSMGYLGTMDLGGESAPLRDFLEDHIYWHQVPKRAVFLGVALRSAAMWRSSTVGPAQSRETVMDVISKVSDKVAVDSPESLKNYRADIERVEKILFRQGWRDPTPEEMNVLQSWHEGSPGDGMSGVVHYPHYLEVENDMGDNVFWEFRGTRGWRDQLPEGPWFAMANQLSQKAWAISARGELERGEATRRRVKAQRRKLQETLAATAESGDFQRVEDEVLDAEMQDVEEHYALNTQEPSVSNFSLFFGRRLFLDDNDPTRWDGANDQAYHDYLRENFSVDTVETKYMHSAAAQEMFPCAIPKLGTGRPFSHYVGLGVVAGAGFTSMAGLGDGKGAHMGYALPDETPVQFDFRAASSNDKPPFMLIAGQPGSGKTVVSQALLHQASLEGVNSIMINPKGADTLAPLLSITGGEHVMIGSDSGAGILDPFRFADQETAVSIARGFLELIATDLDQNMMLQIEDGLRKAPDPKCFRDAIEHVESKEQRDFLLQLQSNPIISLCMGNEAGEFKLKGKSMSEMEQGVLLIEFAPDIQLPQAPTKIADMEWSQRCGVAAVSLLMQATLQMVIASRRGQKEKGSGSFIVIDEAWIILASEYLAGSYMESLGRLGRSLDVTAILSTQRVSDVVDAGLTEYLSRVLLMKLVSPVEQEKGLELLGLEATQDYRELLRESGSRRIEDKRTGEVRRLPPEALMKDLQGRVGALTCEFPPDVLDIYSTNPEDRHKLLTEMEKMKEEEPA